MKLLTLTILCLFCFLFCANSYSQSTLIRYAQFIPEHPDSASSNIIVDMTFLSLDSLHSLQIKYGTESDIDQFFSETYTINSLDSLEHNLITDQGYHTNLSIGYLPLDMNNILTITLLNSSGGVIENKQYK